MMRSKPSVPVNAAAAWEGLAAAMHSAASSYQSEIVGLTAGPWLGPSSALMAAAAAPYMAWTRITAAQAEQTADQVKAAAAAYETAFAEMVPPPAIAANRSLLMALVATNFLRDRERRDPPRSLRTTSAVVTAGARGRGGR